MSPLLKSSEEAGIAAIQRRHDPSQITASDFFVEVDELRKEFASLVGAKSGDRIAVVPSASYGLGNAAKNISLSSNDEVLVLAEQFPSNYYPWLERCNESGARLRIIEAPDTKENDNSWNDKVLDAINPQTKVVAMGLVHWTDGTLFDLRSISEAVHNHDGYLIVDGTQSVGAYPFDIDEINPDALICAGYKWLLGPYGIGLAYFNERFDEGSPIEYNWITRLGSEDFAGLVSYQDLYQPGALRYDSGERSSFTNVAMQLASLKQINAWGVDNIQSYCKQIIEQPIVQLRENGYQVNGTSEGCQHLFGIRAKSQLDPKRIAETLAKNKIAVSVRGSVIRVAPHVYNNHHDIDILVSCLKEI